jgi:S-adenosyl-L-methionine hydrolase (adenosine-forming)
MIFLFTDFGAADLYVGQVKAVLAAQAPRVPVVDLMNDVPSFGIKAGAHLLAALAARIPRGSVTLAVVDPGVGGPRRAVAVLADGRWFAGPDNGLISVTAARAGRVEVYEIGWKPGSLSASFHGRDLFAPVVAMLATGRRRTAKLVKRSRLSVNLGPDDIDEVIYVDHYGNLMTGMRAAAVPPHRNMALRGRRIAHARVFAAAAPGQLFWYENSLGLVEIAANGASAQRLLRLNPGDPLEAVTK